MTEENPDRIKENLRISKENISSKVLALGFLGQTIVSGHLANKHLIKNSREIGKSIDDTIYSFYHAGKTTRDYVFNLFKNSQEFALNWNLGPKPKESDFEILINNMHAKITEEIREGSNYCADQLERLNIFKNQISEYENLSLSNQIMISNLEQQLRKGFASMGDTGNKVDKMPGIGEMTRNLGDVKSMLLGKINIQGGENYEANLSVVSDIYTQLVLTEDYTRTALGQLVLEYEVLSSNKNANQYEIREDYMQKSSGILEVYSQIQEIKSDMTSMPLQTRSREEQDMFESNIREIVLVKDDIASQLERYGFNNTEPPGLASSALPILVGATCILAYAKLVNLEKKIIESGKNVYKNFHNISKNGGNKK